MIDGKVEKMQLAVLINIKEFIHNPRQHIPNTSGNEESNGRNEVKNNEVPNNQGENTDAIISCVLSEINQTTPMSIHPEQVSWFLGLSYKLAIEYSIRDC